MCGELGADENISLLNGFIFRVASEFTLDAGVRVGHIAATNYAEVRAGFPDLEEAMIHRIQAADEGLAHDAFGH